MSFKRGFGVKKSAEATSARNPLLGGKQESSPQVVQVLMKERAELDGLTILKQEHDSLRAQFANFKGSLAFLLFASDT